MAYYCITFFICMDYTKILQEIDLKKTKIDDFGKFPDDVLKKINYKFRLDWNFYSNQMEGGTLTKEETRSVMINNIDLNGKPFKDVAEMRGHDQVVLDVLKMSKGELSLSEKRIKEIHQAIMFEENPEEAAKIGKWKNIPNYIINYKGEKFYFSEPSDVPHAIHQLIDKTNAELEKLFSKKNSRHPIEIASEFHLEYVRIHPFYDGNGRTARILTNVILIACGLPPIIIKENDKDKYGALLADVLNYGGNHDLFHKFIGERVLDSLSIVELALEGKDIDEPNDLDKRIALLERELVAVDSDKEIKILLNKEVYLEIMNSWGLELIRNFVPIAQKFNRLFGKTNHNIQLPGEKDAIRFNDYNNIDDLIKAIADKIENHSGHFDFERNSILMIADYSSLLKGGLSKLEFGYLIMLSFDEVKYNIRLTRLDESMKATISDYCERLLHQPLRPREIKEITDIMAKTILEDIEFQTKQAGLR
jgi:Fic family protein